ncbi:hypothetical protein KIPB_003249, partial [Kipferlia bialata]
GDRDTAALIENVMHSNQREIELIRLQKASASWASDALYEPGSRSLLVSTRKGQVLCLDPQADFGIVRTIQIPNRQPVLQMAIVDRTVRRLQVDTIETELTAHRMRLKKRGKHRAAAKLRMDTQVPGYGRVDVMPGQGMPHRKTQVLVVVTAKGDVVFYLLPSFVLLHTITGPHGKAGPEAPGHHVWLTSLASFPPPTPDHEPVLVTGGSDGSIYLWDLLRLRPAKRLTGHSGPVTGFAWNTDKSQLLSCSADHRCMLWNPLLSNMIGCLTGHTAPLIGVGYCSHTGLVTTVSSDKTIKVWSLRTMTETQSIFSRTTQLPENRLTAMCFDNDRRTLLVAGSFILPYAFHLREDANTSASTGTAPLVSLVPGCRAYTDRVAAHTAPLVAIQQTRFVVPVDEDDYAAVPDESSSCYVFSIDARGLVCVWRLSLAKEVAALGFQAAREGPLVSEMVVSCHLPIHDTQCPAAVRGEAFPSVTCAYVEPGGKRILAGLSTGEAMLVSFPSGSVLKIFDAAVDSRVFMAQRGGEGDEPAPPPPVGGVHDGSLLTEVGAVALASCQQVGSVNYPTVAIGVGNKILLYPDPEAQTSRTADPKGQVGPSLVFAGHKGSVTGLQYRGLKGVRANLPLPSLLSCGDDGSVVIWSPISGEPRNVVRFSDVKGRSHNVRVTTADGQYHRSLLSHVTGSESRDDLDSGQDRFTSNLRLGSVISLESDESEVDMVYSISETETDTECSEDSVMPPQYTVDRHTPTKKLSPSKPEREGERGREREKAKADTGDTDLTAGCAYGAISAHFPPTAQYCLSLSEDGGVYAVSAERGVCNRLNTFSDAVSLGCASEHPVDDGGHRVSVASRHSVSKKQTPSLHRRNSMWSDDGSEHKTHITIGTACGHTLLIHVEENQPLMPVSTGRGIARATSSVSVFAGNPFAAGASVVYECTQLDQPVVASTVAYVGSHTVVLSGDTLGHLTAVDTDTGRSLFLINVSRAGMRVEKQLAKKRHNSMSNLRPLVVRAAFHDSYLFDKLFDGRAVGARDTRDNRNLRRTVAKLLPTVIQDDKHKAYEIDSLR